MHVAGKPDRDYKATTLILGAIESHPKAQALEPVRPLTLGASGGAGQVS
jgi:hypothetical protein